MTGGGDHVQSDFVLAETDGITWRFSRSTRAVKFSDFSHNFTAIRASIPMICHGLAEHRIKTAIINT
jgi:hypothetical protein